MEHSVSRYEFPENNSIWQGTLIDHVYHSGLKK